MSEERWSIPEKWSWASFGEISDIVGGGTPDASDESNFSEQGIPWLTPADLTGYQETYIARGRRDLSEKGYTSSAARLMPAGTVLFSSRAPVGYCAIAANPISTNQGFKSFLLQGGIVPEYARRYLLGSVEYAESKASGTTFKELSGGRAAELAIPLAPLPEQRRIVAKIEALSGASRRARENLDPIPRLVERYKQALLTAAFRGDLTKDWRDQNSEKEGVELLRDLIEAHKKLGYKIKKETYAFDFRKIDQINKIPHSWTWIPLEVISAKIVDGVHKKPEYIESGIPFLTIRNLTYGPDISFEECKFISPEDHDLFKKRTNPEYGDILITKDGTLGVVRSIQTKNEFSIFVSLALLKIIDKSMTKYLELALQSPIMQQQMVGVGSGLQHIHLTDLRKDLAPIAPLKEQAEIVRRLDSAFAWIDRIAAEAGSARKLLDKLDQAVLAKAFRGELVPQDPADEPASALLERIRKARAAKEEASPKAKRGRKAKSAAPQEAQASLI